MSKIEIIGKTNCQVKDLEPLEVYLVDNKLMLKVNSQGDESYNSVCLTTGCTDYIGDCVNVRRLKASLSYE